MAFGWLKKAVGAVGKVVGGAVKIGAGLMGVQLPFGQQAPIPGYGATPPISPVGNDLTRFMNDVMGRVGEIKGVVDTIRTTDPAQIGATVRSATEGYRAARSLDQMLPWILGGGALLVVVLIATKRRG